jgi:hypothetical protein
MRSNLLLIILLATCSIIFAQRVEEQASTMSLGTQNSFYVSIQGADKDILEDTWKSYTKEYGKTKFNKKAKEYLTEKAKVALISGDMLNIYAKLEAGVGEGTARIFVDNGKGFISSSNESGMTEGVKTFLKDYWIIARKAAIAKELKMEEEKSKNLAKDLEKLKDKKKDNDKDIAEYKKKIIELEQENGTNGKDQFKKQAEIDAQNNVIQGVKTKMNGVGKSM